jgi:hypothetical protein
MDPIQPIGPRPPWIAELVAEQTKGVSRERRRKAGGDAKPGPRREPHERSLPESDTHDGDGPEGRHIDVRA